MFLFLFIIIFRTLIAKFKVWFLRLQI